MSIKPFPGSALIVLITLIGLGLVAAHPFLLGKLPLTADGTLHLYRLVSLDHALRHGDLWPRYVPGMAYGYGAPFFNYYAPLSLYPLEILRLLGMSFVQAWLWGMVFYTVVGAVGAYLLGKSWGGTAAGLITAAAYTYAPYMLYDSVWRGTVAEFASLALLPYGFWSLHQLADQGRRRDLCYALLSLALFIPMHNVITLHSTALLAVYAAFLCWRSDSRQQVSLRLILAFALAFGLTAFFWLPALAETGCVKINDITAALPDIDVTRNLGQLADVLALPITADPTQMQPPIPIALGWPQIALAALALVLGSLNYLTQRRKEAKAQLSQNNLLASWRFDTPSGIMWLSVVCIMVLVFLTTEASAPIWRTIPLIRYSQFPWRLVGPASLLLALMAGFGAAAVAERLRSRIRQITWLALCLILPALYTMPYLYPSYPPAPPAHSIIDAQNFERETGWIATSSFGEYIPRWSQTLPDPNRLINRYAQNEVIPRLEPPPGVTITSAEWGMISAKLTLSAESETLVVFDWFYLPGWYATLDGADLTLTPTDPHGLLSATIPPGNHTLDLALGLTPTQSIATIISLVSIAGLAITLAFGFTLSAMSGVHAPQSSFLIPHPSSLIPHYFLLITALTLFAFKLIAIDSADTFIKRERFADGLASGVQHPVNANFENIITLLGYDLLDSPTPSGESAHLNLYWTLNSHRIHEDYSSLIVLRDIAGNELYRTGSFYPGGIASKNWLPGYYVQERLPMAIPPATPPGRYTVEVSLFDPATTRSLNLINAQGNPEDVKFVIGKVEVTRPTRPPTLGALEVDLHSSIALTPELTLLHMQPLPSPVEVGQEAKIVWYWQAALKTPQDYTARLSWIDRYNRTIAVIADIPLVVGYPASQWQRGDIWRGIHRFYIPGRLEAGQYQLSLQIADARGNPVGEYVKFATVEVTAPPRSFDLPEMSTPLPVDWANGIRLLGYDLQQQEALTLTLYWQPQSDLTASLRFFVHLVDNRDHIIAQHDGIPLNWTRPTTGWTPGEVLADTLRLTLPADIPAGGYELRIGWYDPLTKTRVLLVDGGDVWKMPDRIAVEVGQGEP